MKAESGKADDPPDGSGDEDDEDDEDCLRIIEETVVDPSSLPGKAIADYPGSNPTNNHFRAVIVSCPFHFGR
jgi:hypothetical protein